MQILSNHHFVSKLGLHDFEKIPNCGFILTVIAIAILDATLEGIISLTALFSFSLKSILK